MIDRTLPVASNRAVASTVWKIVRKDKRLAITTLVLLIISASAAATATRLLGSIVDAVSADDGVSRVNTIGFWLLACLVTAGSIGLVARRMLARVAERTLTQLRSDAFAASMNLQLDTIERVGTSDPLSRLTGDIGNLSDAAHETAPVFATQIVAVTLTLVALFVTSPVLGLSAFVSIPILAITVKLTIGRLQTWHFKWLEANAEITCGTHEMSDGASTIRTFSAHKAFRQRFDDAVQVEWDLEWPMARLRNILYPMLYICQSISLISVLVVGYYQYSSGAMSLGVVSAGALFVIQAVIPMYLMFDLIEKLQISMAAIGRVVGLINYSQETNRHVADPQLPTTSDVALRDVHFQYNTSHEVLHGINLSIAPGERIAVIGVSGAGKSTIAKLVAGIHEPTSGEILIGSVPVNQLDNSQGRRPVILVTQESHVFIGTIADNCRLARPSATADELRRVLATVDALDWIDALPDGINTHVGRDGCQLNLVQAQQLSLARVLLVNPLVVILDEATAGLGTQMARGIERSFGAVLEGRTVITIAHRLDVAASADRVVVVDHGNVEIGTHEDLLQQDGTYSAMWGHWLELRS